MRPLGRRATKVLERVIRRITQEPKRFDMDFYLGKVTGRDAPSCGTVGCIAGWIALDKYSIPEIRKMDRAKIDDLEGNAEDQARAALGGLPNTSHLFHVFLWPDNFCDAYRAADSSAKRADIAVKRIRHFIRTRE